MKLLLKAAKLTRRHCILFILTFLTLIGLMIGNYMEVLTLGVLSDTGVDFFTLFPSEKEKEKRGGKISFSDVEEKWKAIDKEEEGIITKEKVERYLLTQKREVNSLNRFNRFMYKIKYKIKRFLRIQETIKVFIVLLFFVASFKAFFLFFSRFTTQMLSIQISRSLKERYFDHIQHLPMSFYQKYNIGTLSSRVSGDANQIAHSMNSFITNYLQTPLTILGALVICFSLSWQLSIVIFFGLPMIAIPVIFVTRKVKKITRQLQRNQERFSSVLIDFLAGIQTVKMFAMEAFSFKKYKEQNNQMAKLETKTAKYDLLTRPILHTITTACLASVMIFGLHILHMKVSELIVFVGMLHLFYEPVKKFAEENSNIQKGVVAAERLYEVLNIRPKIQNSFNAISLPPLKKSIEFEKVHFRYEDQWILKDLSFRINKGETVALVGETGVGKSTVVQLLPRLYEVQKGVIRIDGKPLQAYSQKSLRKQIAFVPQKPFLFYDTIEANIAHGGSFSQEEIILAARKAYAHEFIELLPKGYGTMLAETGKNFSGGQQQRLAIARALVKKASILILDEATSSLDALSEEKIKMAIKELHGEITQIIIAHRLTTIEYADRIIYLDKGQKIAEGSKEELLKTCPEFRLLWKMHFHAKRERVK